MRSRLILVLAAAITCAACSPSPTPAPPTVNAATPSGVGQYFFDLLKQPDFARAFAMLAGYDQLPEWARTGGTATPAEIVKVNGHPYLLVAACKPHDCPSERILLLYDENSHAMSGLFARRHDGNDDSNEPGDDELTWLGAPDDAVRRLLRQRLYSPG